MENWRKLSFNYHQIPTLSVLLLTIWSCRSEFVWKLLSGQVGHGTLLLVWLFLCLNKLENQRVLKSQKLQNFNPVLCISFVSISSSVFNPELSEAPCGSEMDGIWAMSWENLLTAYANNKGADQPAHPRSLISTFVVRCLESIIPIVAKSKISKL